MIKNIIIIILVVGFLYSWKNPPHEYTVVTNSNAIVKYWSNERKQMVICGSIQEAINQLSYYGYKFKTITASQAMSSNGGYNFTETIIMEK